MNNPQFEQWLNDFNSEDRTRRQTAMLRLSRFNDRHAVPFLLRALDHRDRDARALVVGALMRIGDAAAVPALIARLDDKSKEVRRMAVRALARLGMAEPVAVLRPLTDALIADEHSAVRWEAAHALRTLHAVAAMPQLIEALTADPNSRVRQAAVEAIGAIVASDDVLPPTRTNALNALEDVLLNDDHLEVRCAAAVVLGQMADTSSIEPLLHTLQTDNSALWHAAAEALWAMEEAATPHIQRAMLSPAMPMRRAALKALLWLSTEFDDDDDLRPDDDGWIGVWGFWN
jgi:HEAT repeat protein